MAKRRVGVEREYSPSMEPVRPGAVSPARALCLPTFSHFVIVNKTSLTLPSSSYSSSSSSSSSSPPPPLLLLLLLLHVFVFSSSSSSSSSASFLSAIPVRALARPPTQTQQTTLHWITPAALWRSPHLDGGGWRRTQRVGGRKRHGLYLGGSGSGASGFEMSTSSHSGGCHTGT